MIRNKSISVSRSVRHELFIVSVCRVLRIFDGRALQNPPSCQLRPLCRLPWVLWSFVAFKHLLLGKTRVNKRVALGTGFSVIIIIFLH